MKKELPPLKHGVQEFEQALQDTKVFTSTIKELEQVLMRCFILVGIRAANLPSQMEKNILMTFIFKKFGGFTLTEIQIAFEKAVAGELECEANCYENFSPAYFGQIMSAYKKWASQKFNKNQMYLVPQETNLLTMPADWKELCEAYYQDYLNNRFVFSVMPYQLYDEFVKCGMMEEGVYKDYLEESRYGLLINLKLDMAETLSENEKEFLREKLEAIQNGQSETKVEQQAKKLAVQFLYKTAKSKGFKNLFIKQ